MLSGVEQGPPPPLLFIDLGTAAIVAAVAFGWPELGADSFSRIERYFAALASRKMRAAVFVGLSVIVLRLAVLPIYGIPLPFNVDDFSFLLSADTFAHGRLTNPTPAMWTHFETIHVTMVPTYQSMYFPGQGLLMAATQVLLGHPWWGVLISSALMCAALTWALQAWIPANWALIGGFVAVFRIGVFSYWTNTYQAGGSLAALGGALVLGSLPRFKKTGRTRYGVLMAIGASILELTRPYEGVLLCLPVAATLLYWMFTAKQRSSIKILARRAVLPILIILGTSVWLGYYDTVAFGKATTLPYTLDRTQYALAPYFIWQHPRPAPQYRAPILHKFYEDEEMGSFVSLGTAKGLIKATLMKPILILLFYASFIFLAPLIMLRRVVLDRRIRFLVVCTGILIAGMTIEVFLVPHYVAPFLVAFYAIGIQAMRHLRVWKPEGRPVGAGLIRLTMVACVALFGLRMFAHPLHLGATNWPPQNWYQYWFGPEHFGEQRAQAAANLESQPGLQLAIVRGRTDREASIGEWVHNGADLEHSKVIWARELGTDEDRQLLRYYKGRTAWLVEPDITPTRITPYPGAEALAAK